MAFWDRTPDADGSAAGNYFPPIDAEYDVQIDAVKHRNGHEGESVIVELHVVTSNNPEIPPGTSKSTAWNITKHKEMAINNIKSFVCGIFGLAEGDKSEPTKAKVKHISKRMVEADNPLMNVYAHLTTWGTRTKKGGEFTNMKWSPYRVDGYVPPMPDDYGYVPPMPSGGPGPSLPAGALPPPPAPRAAPPPPPPVAERYYPEGTAPGRGATHRLVNGAWSPL